MLRTLTTTALSVVALSSAAFAMEPGDLDINGDNFVSLTELRTVFPGFQTADFRDLDTNDDRRLGNQELIGGEARNIVAKYEATAAVVHGITEIDRNGDRFVDVSDLRVFYPGLLDSEFNRIDTNNDDRLNAQELYSPLAQALVTRYEMGGEDLVTIMAVDTDDDFFASFDELSRVYPGLSRIDFEELDQNGDNRVSSQEYYTSEAQSLLDQNL